jgi:hypothetical protein
MRGRDALRRTLTAYGFTDEVAELDRRYPDGAYACPRCLVAYGRRALADEPRTLTEEHVPRASAASGYVCPVDDAAKPFVVGVVVPAR